MRFNFYLIIQSRENVIIDLVADKANNCIRYSYEKIDKLQKYQTTGSLCGACEQNIFTQALTIRVVEAYQIAIFKNEASGDTSR